MKSRVIMTIFPLFCDNETPQDGRFNIDLGLEDDLPCYIEGISLFEYFDGQSLKYFEGQSSINHPINQYLRQIISFSLIVPIHILHLFLYYFCSNWSTCRFAIA